MIDKNDEDFDEFEDDESEELSISYAVYQNEEDNSVIIKFTGFETADQTESFANNIADMIEMMLFPKENLN